MAPRNRKRKRRGGNFQAPPKRGEVAALSEQAAAEAAPKPSRRRSRRNQRERPPSPWGSFPLVELVVLVAMVLLIWGLIVANITMIVAGMTLGMLAGLELSVREHFAGFKSHSTVLAGFAAVVVLGIGFFLLPQWWMQGINLVVAAIVFASCFYLLREAFKRRSGGLGFR